MKKILFLLTFLFALAVGAQAQTNCVELKEIDGTPDVKCVKIIKVTNGTLACTGNTCTITISGGGGGSPGGADTNVQYNNSGSFGGVAGFIFDGTSKVSLGVAGTSVGAVAFRNATSGTITVQPVTGALGTVTLSLPATTGTLALTSQLTSGTVTSVAQSFTGGLISVGGSPITTSGTLALTVAGTSGGIPYFSSGTTWSSSGALTANLPVIGGGAGVAPTVGTRSGNTTQFVTTTGTLTSGDCVKIDASGNFVANGSACGGSGGITVGTTTITSGTSGRVPYNNAGVYGETTGFTSNGTAVTATAGNLIATSPKFITDISDTNGNEIFKITATASAVNEFTIANAATGNSPTITASGGDTDVGLNFTGKGVGGFAFTTSATTGTGTTSGFSVAANSLTTGTGANFASSSVTSGSVVNIASTSTAAASSTLKGLNIAISGANGTTAQTVTGASISVTNTNATSGTNKALVLAASGATTANRAIDVTAGQIVASTGTITTDQPTIDLAQTWNNAGTTFTGLKLNVTSTASNSASLLADFQIGGSSVVKLTRGGSVSITDTGFSEYSFRTTGNNVLRADSSGVAMTLNKLNFSNSYILAWSSTSNWFDTADLFLRRSAAANLAFGAADAASPVAQTLSVQNVVAGTSNTAGVDWTFRGSAGTGTGAGGKLIFQTAPAGTTGTSQNSFVTGFTLQSDGVAVHKSVTFANLPTVVNGGMIFCSDCTAASSPCTSGGTGAMAMGQNSAWKCF